MKKEFTIVSMAILVISTFSLAESRAESPTVRLQLDTSLATFNRTVVEREGDKDYFNSIGFGDFSGYGPGTGYAPGFGFGIGFIPVDNLTIGAKLGVAGGQIQIREFGREGDIIFNNEGEYTANIFSYRALPFVEYKFNLGTVQPFIMASIGYRGGIQWNDDNAELKASNHMFAYGGGGGAHFFLTDAVSIDAGIEVAGGVGKTVIKLDNGETSRSQKADLRDFNAAAKLGLSGWF